MYTLFVIILLSYFIGSFPTSVVWGRLTRRIDIRDYGSKNPGGTNAVRVLGWQAGIVVMCVDIAKGALAAALVAKIRIDPIALDHELVQIIAGTSAVVGHIWTVLAKFKGGKGVATAAGMLIAIYPWAALICFFIFMMIAMTTRYISVGSVTAASVLPFVLIITERMSDNNLSNSLLFFVFLLSGLIVYTHRANLRRLMEGTETRLFLTRPPEKK